MFCVECGKEGKIFRDGSCLSCYLKTHTFTEGPDILDLTICPHCGSNKFKNTWYSEHIGDFLRKVIKSNFKISKELENLDINTECSDTKDGLKCKVTISGLIDDRDILEEHDILFRFERTVCDVCSKRFGGYHEAIVQIRADSRKLKIDELKNIETSIKGLIEDLQAKGNRALFITDIAEEHGGLDFFLSEKSAGLVVAKKIQEQYGGEIKQSSKNIGMKDGKQIYRMTYLIRLPSYEKGIFLKYNNSYYQIITFHGNMVKLIDLSNWNELTFDVKSIQKASNLGKEDLTKEMILVSQNNDEVQVMDQKNYEIKVIKKPKPISFESKTIRIVKLEDKFFLIPVVDK
jgi:nonsense-mediated mRNA decay protein 3